MPTKETEIRALMDKMATPTSHSTICKCSMCMKGDKLSAAQRAMHVHELQSTMVDRRNPDNPDRPLMKAMEAHAIIQTGTQVDMLIATGIDSRDLPKRSTPALIEPRELTIKATWKNRHQEKAVSGRDASVFGALGVLLIPKGVSIVNIPKMDASAVPERFLDKYGAQLIPLDRPVELDKVDDPSLKDLYLVQYDFDKDYIEEYVMKKMGGGGLFVETHPFPHVFTPLDKSCEGALILGVQNPNGTISFAAFQIPFGYTMKLKSNVIHGDSFFVGPYAIALTETELADSVLFRQEIEERDIQRVAQTTISVRSLPLLAEYRLAKAVNHALLIELIMRLEAPKEEGFFLRLPPDVLSRVKVVSKEAERAYDIQRASWGESIEVVDDNAEEALQHHTFFKAPKPKLAITDEPKPTKPTKGMSG